MIPRLGSIQGSKGLTSAKNSKWPKTRHPRRYFSSHRTSSDAPPRREVALYVHWPYCKSICPYCDFNRYLMPSVDRKDTSLKDIAQVHKNVHSSMREALLTELDTNLKAYSANLTPKNFKSFSSRIAPISTPVVTSIFFGGGTPSLAEPETFAELIYRATVDNPPGVDVEITMEANPTSIETSKLKKFREAGINRLSMGVQSLDAEDLRYLGRNHSVGDAERCFELARNVFDRVSFDLIYARHPDQTGHKWREELRKALKMGPTHLSLYSLTFEGGTPFHRALEQGKLTAPSADLAAELYDISVEETSKFGLEQYEVSNFALKGQECRHNLNYWKLGDYIGIGPGAASRITARHSSLAGSKLVRYAGMATKAPEKWKQETMNLSYSAEYELLSPKDSFLELMLTGIRTKEGISMLKMAEILEFEDQVDLSSLNSMASSKIPLSSYIDLDSVKYFVDSGHLEEIQPHNPSIKATPKGLAISDTLLKRIIV